VFLVSAAADILGT